MPIGKPIVNGRFRETLSQKDIRFVVTTLAPSEKDADGLLRLLTDDASRDMILDSPPLLRKLERLSEVRPPLSLELYFYIALRPVLKARGLDVANLADYVAAIFAREMRYRIPALDEPAPVAEGEEGKKTVARRKTRPLTADLVEALSHAQGYEWFSLAVAAADQSLLLTGVFSDTLYTPNRGRIAPGPNYYETTGKNYYRAASIHQVAGEFEIKGLLELLAENFVKVREALSEVKEKYLSAEELTRK